MHQAEGQKADEDSGGGRKMGLLGAHGLVEHPEDDDFARHCRSLFRRIDVDQEGKLEPAEILDRILKLGYHSISYAEAEKFVVNADVDHDGYLMENEFLQFMREVR